MELPKIKLPSIKTKYKILAMAGIVTLLLGYYYDHAYKPHAEKIAEIKEELLQLDDTITIIKTVEYPKISTDIKILEKIDAKKKAIIVALNKLEKNLPNKTAYSKMLETITRLAYKSGFDIKTLEPKNFTTKEGYQSMSISMDISSRFDNLLDFLEALKPYPIYLENINLTISQRPVLKINLNLFILFK